MDGAAFDATIETSLSKPLFNHEVKSALEQHMCPFLECDSCHGALFQHALVVSTALVFMCSCSALFSALSLDCALPLTLLSFTHAFSLSFPLSSLFQGPFRVLNGHDASRQALDLRGSPSVPQQAPLRMVHAGVREMDSPNSDYAAAAMLTSICSIYVAILLTSQDFFVRFPCAVEHDTTKSRSHVLTSSVLSLEYYIRYAAYAGGILGFSTFGPQFVMGLGYFDEEFLASIVFGGCMAAAGLLGTPIGTKKEGVGSWRYRFSKVNEDWKSRLLSLAAAASVAAASFLAH